MRRSNPKNPGIDIPGSPDFQCDAASCSSRLRALRLIMSSVQFLPASYRIAASARASRTESFFHEVELSSLQLLVPLGQAQRKPNTSNHPSSTSVSSCISTIRASASMLRTVFLYFLLISAGLAPAGSQLVGYNESSALARSPSGSSRWEQRLISYAADTCLRILS